MIDKERSKLYHSLSTMSHDWPTSLLCPCQDAEICCLSCLCPCYEYAEVAAAFHGTDDCCGNCLLWCICSGCACIYAGETRHAIRDKYGIEGSPCWDCLVMCGCPCCGLAQMAILLKQKGAMGSRTSGRAAPKRQRMYLDPE